jgi:hypothetical protein
MRLLSWSVFKIYRRFDDSKLYRSVIIYLVTLMALLVHNTNLVSSLNTAVKTRHFVAVQALLIMPSLSFFWYEFFY